MAPLIATPIGVALRERIEGLQNSGWWLLFISTAIFHFIFGLFNYIFLIKNIELLK